MHFFFSFFLIRWKVRGRVWEEQWRTLAFLLMIVRDCLTNDNLVREGHTNQPIDLQIRRFQHYLASLRNE